MSRHKRKNRNHSKKQNTSEKEVLVNLDETSGQDASDDEAPEEDQSEEGAPAAEGSAEEETPSDDEQAPSEEETAEDEPETAEEKDASEEDTTEEAASEKDSDEEETSDSEDDESDEDPSDEGSATEEKGKEDTASSKDRKKVSREELREKSENERNRREARRKRRIRQQATAYVILVIILALLAFGIYYGAKSFAGYNRDRGQSQEVPEPQPEPQDEPQVPVVEPEPDPGPTVEDLGPTPSERFDEAISAIISNMTLEEKIQGLMFITPESITGVDRVVIAGEGTAAALSDFCPGGIVYSSKNVTSADQFSGMLDTTRSLVGDPLFLAVSETGLDESGLIRSGVISSVPTPAQSAESGNVEEVVTTGSTIGEGLLSIGITVDFAPMADLAVTNGGVMNQTTYGSDAASVTPYVTGMAEGLSASGVVAAYKYFPSLAASAQNPLYGRAVSDRSIDDFRNNEFQVWLSAINAGAKMIQMSNVIYPSIDSDSLPSSLSEKTVTGVLRDELGYDGVIVSGPLNDGAITAYYTPAESAVMALKSGCDMIYSSPDPRAAVSGIEEAVGSGVISEERINDALYRIYSVMYADSLVQFRIEYEAGAAAMGVDLTGVSY